VSPLHACHDCGAATPRTRFCDACAAAHNATDGGAPRRRSTTNVSRGRREALRSQAWAAYDGVCRRCGLPIDPDEPWDLGHIVAKADGGTVTPDNLAPEHRRCNRSAGASR
jgi:hypothetical protein